MKHYNLTSESLVPNSSSHACTADDLFMIQLTSPSPKRTKLDHGFYPILRTLVNNPFNFEVNPHNVNTPLGEKRTLLYNSVKAGSLRKVKYLVEEKAANVNLGKDAKSPLYEAVFYTGINKAYYLIAEYLIEHKAINSFYGNYSPLHLAAINCLPSILQKFAEFGYDFTIKTTNTNQTVLEQILSSEKPDAIIQMALGTIPQNQLKILVKESKIDLTDVSKEVATFLANVTKTELQETLSFFDNKSDLEEELLGCCHGDNSYQEIDQ